MFSVKIKKRALKQLMLMDEVMQHHFDLFFQTDLLSNPFVGKLAENRYHAHVKYHYVAVWEIDKFAKTITILYAGCREDAPY